MHLEDHTLPCVLYHHGEIDEVVPDSIARADSYWPIENNCKLFSNFKDETETHLLTAAPPRTMRMRCISRLRHDSALPFLAWTRWRQDTTSSILSLQPLHCLESQLTSDAHHISHRTSCLAYRTSIRSKLVSKFLPWGKRANATQLEPVFGQQTTCLHRRLHRRHHRHPSQEKADRQWRKMHRNFTPSPLR